MKKFRDRAMRWAALFLAVLACVMPLSSRALAAGPNVKVAVPKLAGDDITFDATRYLNQNFWYQSRSATVWWAGFDEFEQSVGRNGGYLTENNYLVPNDGMHVKEVVLTHLTGGRRDGVSYRVPHGNGTNAVSGDAVSLGSMFPQAKPFSQAEADQDDNAYPAAHDYYACGEEEATHLTVDWTINGFPSGYNLGLVARGTHNWDAATGKADTIWVRVPAGIQESDVPTEEFMGYPVEKRVEYFKAALPDSPKAGHDFAVLDITPEFGYHVTDVVVTCCFRGNAYTNCSVYNTGHAFQQNFGVGKGDTVSLVLDSESFCHGSSGGPQGGTTSKYYIMIRTEPVPNELFVEYGPGEIVNAALTHDVKFGREDEWLVMDSRGNRATEHLSLVSDRIGGPGHQWKPGDLDYMVDSVRPDVLRDLSMDGWQFVGWNLEYYPEAENDRGEILFDGGKWNELAVGPDDGVRLKMHAKLTAQWEESRLCATVTKTVRGLEPGDVAERSYAFRLTTADGKPVALNGKKLGTLVKDGREVVEFVDDKRPDGTFTIEVAGNASSVYRFCDLPPGDYVIEETIGDDASFSVSYSTQTFTVTERMAPVEISVTNEYGSSQPGGLELPRTGGAGVLPYVVSGFALALPAGLLLVGARRRR